MLKYEKNAFIYSYLGFTTRGWRLKVHSAWVVMVAKNKRSCDNTWSAYQRPTIFIHCPHVIFRSLIWHITVCMYKQTMPCLLKYWVFPQTTSYLKLDPFPPKQPPPCKRDITRCLVILLRSFWFTCYHILSDYWPAMFIFSPNLSISMNYILILKGK